MATGMRTFTIVEWMDPVDNDDGWISEEDIRRLSNPAIITTYGELIEENELFIKLGYNVEGTTRAVHKDGVVIKSTIVRRRDYKYPWRVPFKIKQAKKVSPFKAGVPKFGQVPSSAEGEVEMMGTPRVGEHGDNCSQKCKDNDHGRNNPPPR